MHRLSAIRLRHAAAKPTLVRGMHKEIKFSNEGRASILKGVDVLANAVQVTLGPKGMHVYLCVLIHGTDHFQVATPSLNSRLVVQKSPITKGMYALDTRIPLSDAFPYRRCDFSEGNHSQRQI